MRNALPGQPVRGSRTGAPIMALFDLLGRRWAMGVLWTLAEVGPCTFRELQHRCETISPAVLNIRLKELRASQLITHSQNGYAVLPRGRELYAMLVPLGKWSKSWAKDVVTGSACGESAVPAPSRRGEPRAASK